MLDVADFCMQAMVACNPVTCQCMLPIGVPRKYCQPPEALLSLKMQMQGHLCHRKLAHAVLLAAGRTDGHQCFRIGRSRDCEWHRKPAHFNHARNVCRRLVKCIPDLRSARGIVCGCTVFLTALAATTSGCSPLLWCSTREPWTPWQQHCRCSLFPFQIGICQIELHM